MTQDDDVAVGRLIERERVIAYVRHLAGVAEARRAQGEAVDAVAELDGLVEALDRAEHLPRVAVGRRVSGPDSSCPGDRERVGVSEGAATLSDTDIAACPAVAGVPVEEVAASSRGDSRGVERS